MKCPDINRVKQVINENRREPAIEIVSIRKLDTNITSWDITYTDQKGRFCGFQITEEMLNDNSDPVIKQIRRDAEILTRKANTAENALHSLALKALDYKFDFETKTLIIYTDDGRITI